MGKLLSIVEIFSSIKNLKLPFGDEDVNFHEKYDGKYFLLFVVIALIVTFLR